MQLHSPLQKIPAALWALGGGLLLWAAWPVSPLTFLIFVAWIPLLWLANRQPPVKKYFGWVYLHMLTWNLATTWWIWNATQPGSVAAILVNSLLMCLPWIGYRRVAKKRGRLAGYLALVAYWMCFECIHLQDWGLSWPWLTLGNAFATHPNWVQWYEYTGAAGGSLWILLVNILLFEWMRHYQQPPGTKPVKKMVYAATALALPLLISYFMIPSVKNKVDGDNVVVVQPNIDPYEKISSETISGQLQVLIKTSEAAIDENTRLLIWPETALYKAQAFDEQQLRSDSFLNPLWQMLAAHPRLQLFTGIESYRFVTEEERSGSARKARNSDDYYERYNGSVLLSADGPQQFYHKTMLVPGVETLPGFLKFLSSWFEKFGGTGSGYTKQKDRTVIPSNSYQLAPAICYESIYGDFIGRYIDKGANLIVIVTNDGWWKNTPGHKQHMNYARLRAIENRKWVARSANTGISCFIDPAGKVYEPRGWDVRDAIKKNIQATSGQTFYARYGDWLFKLAVFLAAFFILWGWWNWLHKRLPLK
jgi:apolipoprotein N-acyltransferase